MKRILVTGANGFIGRETIAPLMARGFDVHTVGRSPPDHYGCHDHRCDLINGDVSGLIADIAPSHLLHLAWYAVPGKFWTAPENLDWVAASLRLVGAFARAGGVRATVAGSCAEYDWSEPVLDDRTTALQPATLYGISKLALFRILQAAAPAIGLELGWGRVFFPFGPREQSGRLLSDVIDGVAAGRRVPCSDGLQQRDFMHVEDVGAAFAALADSNVNGAVNIASGTSVAVRELVMAAAALAGDVRLIDWGARPRQADEPETMVATIARLHNEVGFRPRWDLQNGVANAVARRLAA